MESGVSRPDAALANFLIGLRSAGIRRNAILTAFEETQRRAFLPPELRQYAYAPFALPIACGEQATPPQPIARLIALADPVGTDRVMEIGAGTGFQTALLARTSRSVVSFERWRSLADAAGAVLARQGVRNAEIRHADGLALRTDERFSLIVVNAALGEIPPGLLALLAPEGRIIAPLMRSGGTQLVCWREGSFQGDGPFIDITPFRIGVSRAL